MFLKRLEINGFKSFAAKTALDFLFDPENRRSLGITAIVGPNGSGKSNIADAICWVMGEQSMKNLRGKKSEDVIFAGSGKKARLGGASATLYLDNSDKKIPLDFSEVTIARKIFRSGESEYLVNGSRVRLQDVADMLASAGVGKESYAIINQGMADSILNATPAERRVVIEDAAGVKQFQIKKERSLRKLESTRQNLEKIQALREEIKPHLRMLKKQAEKAAQSEAVAKELIEKQTKLYSCLWHNWLAEQNKLNEEKDDIGRTMMNVQRDTDRLADLISLESRDESREKTKLDLEARRQEILSKLNLLERDLILSEGRMEIEKERQKTAVVLEEIKSIPVDLKYVRSNVEEIRNDQERLIERLNRVEKIEDLQDIREYARAIQQKLFELKGDIERGKIEENKGKQDEISEQKKALQKKQAEIILEFEGKINKIRQEIKKAEEESEKIQKLIGEENEKNRINRQKFFEAERKLRQKQDELNKLKDKYNDSKIELAKVEVREEDLKSQIAKELRKKAEDLLPIEGVFDRGNLENEIQKLKIKMEQIGGIDPVVAEEYGETRKRFEFLSSESDDLEKAILALKQVVKEMENKIEHKFAAAYEEINKEFIKYFKIIFGGGSARLIKSRVESRKPKNVNAEENGESKDEINSSGEAEETEKTNEETGIEISACPPGKKISHLSMLSGGERSLTSLALLFAIISHNPPPFAVLDEVEAALDEANSRRFGRIITELSGHTQFVIITHNRETMRQASLLYGVTMGEDGISKLLSVKIDQVGAGGKIINPVAESGK